MRIIEHNDCTLIRMVSMAIFLMVMVNPCAAQSRDDAPSSPHPQFLRLDLLRDHRSTERVHPAIPPNQASMAFFCRQERHRDKWLGIPVRLRLGDQATVDQMERKR